MRGLLLCLVLAISCAACTAAESNSAESNSAEPSAVDPSSPASAEPSPGPTSVSSATADAKDAEDASPGTTPKQPANSDEAAGSTLTAWFSSISDSGDPTAIAPVARSVPLADSDNSDELTQAWITTWLDGPTTSEERTGLEAPFAIHTPDVACGGRFNWRILGDKAAGQRPLLVVTLCGNPVSPGHAHTGAVWASFTATMAELPHIDRAVLLEPHGARCFGDESGERLLHCLASPDHQWQDYLDLCTDDRLPWLNAPIHVTNIAEEDPDGGLITHTEPGASTPEVEVLTNGTDDLWPTLRCTVTDDGGVWWEFVTANDTTTPVWANAAYLAAGPAHPAPVLESPCAEFPPVGQGFVTSGTTEITHDHVAGLAVRAVPKCTILEITMGQGWNDDLRTSTPSKQLEAGIRILPIDTTIGHYVLQLPNASRGTYGGITQRDINVDATFDTQQVRFGSAGNAGIAFVASTGDFGGSGPSGEVVILTGSSMPPSVITLDDPARVFLAIPQSPLANPPQILQVAGRPVFVVSRVEQLEDGAVVVAGWGLGFEGHASATITNAAGDEISRVGSFSVGNPGVAWSPFKLIIAELPANSHQLTFDSCDQCDDGDTVSIPLPIN